MEHVPNVLNQAPDDPRLLLSEPFRAVHFVFGLFYPDYPALPGRALLGALRALGFGDEAARGALLRLRRAGFLHSTPLGREAVYTLDDRSRALVKEIAARATELPQWDGRFLTLLVSIPPQDRAFREIFRRGAIYAGLGSPAPGVWIGTDQGWIDRARSVLRTAPAGTSVAAGALVMELDDARTVASAAWNLDALGARIADEAARLEELAARAEQDRPAGEEALAFLWESIGPFFALLSERPPLPAALLPAGWPVLRAHVAFLDLAAWTGGAARSYVELLAAPRSGPDH